MQRARSSRMTMTLGAAAAVSALATTGIGCAVGGAKTDPDQLDFVEGDRPHDGSTRVLHLRGVLGFGESVTGEYGDLDSYAGWVFSGVAGTTARISAHPEGRTDTVLHLYGPLRRGSWASAPRVAINDDVDGEVDSEIEIELRASGIYLVVVREPYDRAGTFELSLVCAGGECRVACEAGGACEDGAVCSPGPCIGAGCRSYCRAPEPAVRCLADDDCVPVPTGCCPCSVGGTEIAVNVDHAAESLPVCDRGAAVECGDSFLCHRRAACVNGHCEMVD
jgi:hypothetical protein